MPPSIFDQQSSDKGQVESVSVSQSSLQPHQLGVSLNKALQQQSPFFLSSKKHRNTGATIKTENNTATIESIKDRKLFEDVTFSQKFNN